MRLIPDPSPPGSGRVPAVRQPHARAQGHGSVFSGTSTQHIGQPRQPHQTSRGIQIPDETLEARENVSQRSPGARGRPTTAPTEVSARTPRPLSRPAPPPARGCPTSLASGHVRPRLPPADVPVPPPPVMSGPASPWRTSSLPQSSCTSGFARLSSAKVPASGSVVTSSPASRPRSRPRTPPPPLVCPPRRSGGFPPARLSHYQRVGKGWCRFPAVPVTRRGRESEQSWGVAGGGSSKSAALVPKANTAEGSKVPEASHRDLRLPPFLCYHGSSTLT